MMQEPWIGVDLDGTLAKFVQEKHSADFIGEPIIPILEQVKLWVLAGKRVKIFTARVDGGISGHADSHLFKDKAHCEMVIKAWCLKHVGKELEVTNVKDGSMVLLLDDRCYRVEHNTGRIFG